LDTTQVFAWLSIIGGLVTMLGGGGILGWWWRKQPEREAERARNAAVADAILGRAEVLDLSRNEIAPAQPGLVHRVSGVEEAVVEFRHAIGLLTETLKRIDTLDARLQVLERATAERLLTKAESAAMWKAIADRDDIDGETGE
jgi:hypothetical protein